QSFGQAREPQPLGKSLEIAGPPQRIPGGEDGNPEAELNGEDALGRGPGPFQISSERQRRGERPIAGGKARIEALRLAQPADRLVVPTGDELGQTGNGAEPEVQRVERAQPPRIAQALECLVGPTEEAVGRPANAPREGGVLIEL